MSRTGSVPTFSEFLNLFRGAIDYRSTLGFNVYDLDNISVVFCMFHSGGSSPRCRRDEEVERGHGYGSLSFRLFLGINWVGFQGPRGS